MSKELEPAEIALKIGQAHSYLRKFEKIFTDLDYMDERIAASIIELLSICDAKATSLI